MREKRRSQLPHRSKMLEGRERGREGGGRGEGRGDGGEDVGGGGGGSVLEAMGKGE